MRRAHYRLKLRSRIRAGGLLELTAPTPFPEGEVEVDLLVRPVAPAEELPRGTRGDQLLDLVGILPEEDAEQMLRAIEEGCERVERDGQVGALRAK
ncbi:MAG: hypothetical protein NZM28_06175 [Fimbriimonadales bacterium]|nr:hypothetical protein [Fimbriimonadales bacterium]